MPPDILQIGAPQTLIIHNHYYYHHHDHHHYAPPSQAAPKPFPKAKSAPPYQGTLFRELWRVELEELMHVLMPQLAEADLHSMTVQYMAELLSLAVDRPDGTLPTTDRRLMREMIRLVSASFQRDDSLPASDRRLFEGPA